MRNVNWVRKDRGVADEMAGRKAFHDGCRFRASAPLSWRKGYMQARALASRDAAQGSAGDSGPARRSPSPGDGSAS